MNAAPQPAQTAAHRTLHLLAPSVRQRHSPLALWHLLSLDAPSVAALWTVFVAHVYGTPLAWPVPAAMFVAVWMIYAADRLLDARLAMHDASVSLELRHRFHHNHRSAFLAAFALAALALLWLLSKLHIDVFRTLATLSVLLISWMLAIHVRPRGPNWRRMPKELGVGIFFSAAVWSPVLASAMPRLTMLPAAVLFAMTCTLNCLYLFAWEQPATGATNNTRLHGSTRWGTTHLDGLTITLIATAALTAVFWRPASIAIACAISAGLLLGLHHLRHRTSAVHLRAAADVALLTPLLLLAVQALHL